MTPVLVPGLVVPANVDYLGYHKYIDEVLPLKSEVHYGLHSSAETKFLTAASDNLFRTLLELQSRDVITNGGISQSAEEKVSKTLRHARKSSQNGVTCLLFLHGNRYL